jgi:hypothetical protein
MLKNTDLTEHQWQTAHAIAIALEKEQTRLDSGKDGLRSELEKSIVYLRSYLNQDNIGQRFFTYLEILSRQGQKIGHSGKTKDYYKAISDICHQYLKVYENNPAVMLQIMGWVKRLMRYYHNPEILNDVNLDEIRSNVGEITSKRQLEIAQIIENQSFERGQEIEAKVIGIKKTEVVYEISGISLKQKEPKSYDKLTEGDHVIVEITVLTDNRFAKRVKYKRHLPEVN